MSELDELRKEKDAFFGEGHHSPLTPEQRAEFAGLAYFPENLELRLELAEASSTQILRIQVDLGIE